MSYQDKKDKKGSEKIIKYRISHNFSRFNDIFDIKLQ